MLSLLVGGARSGKSTLALRMAEHYQAERADAQIVYIATGEAGDDEMRQRIDAHRAERAARPSPWSTIEEPLQIASTLAGLPVTDSVLVDCLTLWASNAMSAGWPDDHVLGQAQQAAICAAGRPGSVVVVTNEVGSGIVPFDPYTRRYRDLLGRTNSIFAEHAARAYFVAAGRLLELRSPAELGL